MVGADFGVGQQDEGLPSCEAWIRSLLDSLICAATGATQIKESHRQPSLVVQFHHHRVVINLREGVCLPACLSRVQCVLVLARAFHSLPGEAGYLCVLQWDMCEAGLEDLPFERNTDSIL